MPLQFMELSLLELKQEPLMMGHEVRFRRKIVILQTIMIQGGSFKNNTSFILF